MGNISKVFGVKGLRKERVKKGGRSKGKISKWGEKLKRELWV